MFEWLSSYIQADNNLSKVIIGVAAILLQKGSVFIYQYINKIIYSRNNFTISGTWLAAFPSHIKGKNNYEVVKIKQKREDLKLYIHQYTNTSTTVNKYKGRGICRAGQISAVYYPLDKSYNQIGVFALKITNMDLGKVVIAGKYAEFINEKEAENIAVCKDAYVLERINLPFYMALKLTLGLSCFEDYNHISKKSAKYYFNPSNHPIQHRPSENPSGQLHASLRTNTENEATNNRHDPPEKPGGSAS